VRDTAEVIINRKSRVPFRLVSNSVTLNDLERKFNAYKVSLAHSSTFVNFRTAVAGCDVSVTDLLSSADFSSLIHM